MLEQKERSDEARATVGEAVARARLAQRAWGALSHRQRAQRMRALREVLVRRADEVIETIHAETGKPRVEALGHEVMVVASLIRTYEKRAPWVLRPRGVGTGILVTKRGTKLYEPYGVVGVISPWNFPFSLPAIPTVSALFAGNAVVLKPSEVTPRTGALLGVLVREALPDHPDLVQVIGGGGAEGAALVASGVDKIAFIGSPATARRVLAGAAETLTPVVIELGANDVAIVCDDADPERAAAGIVWGAMSNAGQVCMSTERALVAASIYDRFAEALAREVGRLRTGGEGDVDVGPLIYPPQRRVIDAVVEDARGHGARIIQAPVPAAAGERVYPPTLLLDAHKRMRLHEEETFGPVLAVTPVRDDDEALRIANSGRYGLNATVWTRSAKRGRRIARRLDAGSVMVNDALVNFGLSELPYGGVKESGYGRLQGDEGLLEFARVKAVAETRLAMRRELLWFPYRPATYRLLRRVFSLVFSTRRRRIPVGVRPRASSS
jgi:succinate-semialdehyde dehydrogenase/glutarate-semialdehyde dehydrogenase